MYSKSVEVQGTPEIIIHRDKAVHALLVSFWHLSPDTIWIPVLLVYWPFAGTSGTLFPADGCIPGHGWDHPTLWSPAGSVVGPPQWWMWPLCCLEGCILGLWSLYGSLLVLHTTAESVPCFLPPQSTPHSLQMFLGSSSYSFIPYTAAPCWWTWSTTSCIPLGLVQHMLVRLTHIQNIWQLNKCKRCKDWLPLLPHHLCWPLYYLEGCIPGLCCGHRSLFNSAAHHSRNVKCFWFSASTPHSLQMFLGSSAPSFIPCVDV